MPFIHFPCGHHSHDVDGTVLPTQHADEPHSPNPWVPTLHTITFDFMTSMMLELAFISPPWRNE